MDMALSIERSNMASRTISLDLRQHCIATEIRKKYNRLLSQCLKSKQDDETREHDLELLKQALETLDFPKLRAHHPELAGGSDIPVTLGFENGKLSISSGHNPLDLPYVSFSP